MSRRIDYEKERKRNQIVGQGSEISHPDNYSFDMKRTCALAVMKP